MYFGVNKCSLGEHKRFISKTFKNFMTPNYQGGMTSNVVHLLCKAWYLNDNFLIVQLDPFTFIIKQTRLSLKFLLSSSAEEHNTSLK